MHQKSAEFRQRGGEVYLRTDVVAVAVGAVETGGGLNSCGGRKSG